MKNLMKLNTIQYLCGGPHYCNPYETLGASVDLSSRFSRVHEQNLVGYYALVSHFELKILIFTFTVITIHNKETKAHYRFSLAFD
jgi:hypothetical protein